jgi:hypothetical protein
MQHRDSVQILRKLRFLQTHNLHSIVSKMTRRAQDRPLREWSIGGSEIYSRKILPWRLSIDGYLDIGVHPETKQPTNGKNFGAMVQPLVKAQKVYGVPPHYHINRVFREICQTVTQKWINDSLDGYKACQLRRSLCMRKAIKGSSKKDVSVFFQSASGHANIGTYLKRIGRNTGMVEAILENG